MSQQIDEAIDRIRSNYNRQLRWFITVVAAFILSMGGFGINLTIQANRNTEALRYVIEDLNNTVSYETWFLANSTYELEFRAVTAFLNGESDELNAIMEEFHNLRWRLLGEDVVRDLRKTYRGINSNVDDNGE